MGVGIVGRGGYENGAEWILLAVEFWDTGRSLVNPTCGAGGGG